MRKRRLKAKANICKYCGKKKGLFYTNNICESCRDSFEK